MESGKFNGMDKVYCLASILRLIYFHKLLPKVSQSGKNLTARDIRVLNVFQLRPQKSPLTVQWTKLSGHIFSEQ